jgi:heme oxygenase
MKLSATLLAGILASQSYAFAPHKIYHHHPSRVVGVVSSSSLIQLSTTTEEAVVVETAGNDVVANPRLSGLALMLDDGTRKSHSMAENTQFVSGFFKGLADRDSYRSLITSLYFVYEAMEEAMDKSLEDGVRTLDYPALRRLDSLKKDMDFFYGEKWQDDVVPSPAAKAYVARIVDIAQTKPYLMIAHQYTRYLGDLFGGQMMGGMAIRSLSLENGDGTAFYTFDDIPSTKDFITEWYTRLNELDLTQQQKEEIVDEANLVFALNIDVLQELEGSPLKAMLTLAVNSLKEKRLWPFL